MAVAKVCGIETEYGIQLSGAEEPNPMSASSFLINAYLAEIKRNVDWDFEDESPGRDARGFAREGSLAPIVETHLVNSVLTNGARYYVDHAHPEYATPECTNALDVVRWDRAGEVILIRSMAAAGAILPPGQRIVIYKNNSDGKGNSYGCHENYLMDRNVPFSDVVGGIMSHFVTRQIYAGAGKVGSESSYAADRKIPYQLSQRADFCEEEVGLETTLKRPIINTRDEPHADAKKYRRLHVIVGDANLSDMATFLKVGVTSLLLAMIEDGFTPARDLSLASPVRAIKEISWDPSLKATVDLAAGGSITALELQWELYETARKYAEEFGLECLGAQGEQIIEHWGAVLEGLESDPMKLSAEIDWVAKLTLVQGYKDRHQLDWSNPKLAALDLQYHDLRPDRTLFGRLPTKRLVEQATVEEAVTEPPRDTRAYFRGRCLQRWANSITAANWDSLVFDLGYDPLRRVPMMEPLRGTAEMVDTLLDQCTSPADLVARLGS